MFSNLIFHNLHTNITQEIILQTLVMEDCYSLFINSIKSQHTQKYYSGVLNRFKEFCQVKNYTDLLFGSDRKQVEAKLIAWLTDQKAKGVKASTLNGYLAALWHFYQHNDVSDVNWTKVKAFMPEKSRPTKDRAYTVEELRKVLDFCDFRLKVVFLLMCSAGLRIGAIPSLKVKDLEKMDNIYKLTVYEGSGSEYQTFCTPECTRAIDDYLDYRRRAGEEVKPEAPLIREQIAIPNQPKVVQVWNLTQLTVNALENSGVRTPGTDRHKRHETMANHACRKFAKQQMRRAKVDPVIIERLLGHQGDPQLGVTKLMLTYDPAELEEIKAEYMKAVDSLTISTERKLRLENEELKKKVLGESKIMLEVEALRKKQEEDNKMINDLVADLYEKKPDHPMFRKD